MNRIRTFSLSVITILTIGSLQAQEDLFKAPERGIVSWLPASSWEHALLSGNGTLGALVMGHPHEETILLSHSGLYVPQLRSAKPFSQAGRLEEIRKLMLEGKFVEATKIPVAIREQEKYTDERDPFIPGFDLKIDQEASNVIKYNRTVNYQTGETSVNWHDNNGSFQRKLFVSRADSMIVLSIKGTDKINCSVNFEHRPIEWQQSRFVKDHIGEMTSAASDQWLTYRSNFKNKYDGSLEGYEGVGRLIVTGGTSTVNENKLIIKDADQVLLLIKIEPTYHYMQSGLPGLKKKLEASASSYSDLLNRHAALHGDIFNRVKFELNGSPQDRSLNTEELLLKSKDKVPQAMIEKVFDAGRYNILSCMGTNPPNLQGLWNGTWTTPWASGMTHDGNLPTAVSIPLPGNMPELMKAFFNYHEKLLPDYRLSAKTLYNCRGIHIPAQTTSSGVETDFGETWCLTFWTGAAGWASNFFYDYYQYTGDAKFLAEHAYPFMKESLLFYEDFLTLDKNNKYIFNPSYSPENNPANSISQAALNATMDVMIAKQLLRNCIRAAKVLKTDPSKIKQWELMLTKMPAYEVSKEGTLREWLWPGLDENYKHRHSSHLYALYDEVDADFKSNETLRQAASRAIDERMKFRIAEGGGEMAFGLVQLALASAHLGEAEKSHQIVQWLSSKYWTTGMGSFHNVGALFNTDISGGLPYVITQMLTYSEDGLVSILPALPKEWNKGKIEGILLRGQVEVKKLSWNDKVVEVTLHSGNQKSIELKFPSSIKNFESAGKQIKLKHDSRSVNVTLPTSEDISFTVVLE